MNPGIRRQQIISLLNKAESGLMTIAALSAALDVSEMTVRRDLEQLEAQDLLRRIYAGAIALKGVVEQPFVERAGQSSPQKVVIGKIAASLVADGQSLFLDSGTTTRQVARYLCERKALTVVTNNIPISEELGQQPEIKTFLLGGLVKPREQCTVGFSVRQALETFSVDIAFLGAASFSRERGIMDLDINEVEIKQTGIRIAHQVILVSDSRKFNQTALMRVAPLTAVHKIITDDDFPKDEIQAIEAKGIEVITPERIGIQL